jgi:hypothetical protein
MYRIRLTDGRELEFPSIQEFSAAVHDGTVDEDASIFHRRAERWLPVREHPHYIQARAQTPAPRPRPAPPAPESDGVDLDAILSLLDAPSDDSAPSRQPAPPPAEPVRGESPVDAAPAAGSVNELEFLRTGLETGEAELRQETAEAEAKAEADAEAAGEPVESDVTEPMRRIADDIEEVPQEPLPIEALAPDEPPASEAPLASPLVTPETPRDATWNRAPEPALPKLDLDPLGGDFGRVSAPNPATRQARLSRWAPPPREPEQPVAPAAAVELRSATMSPPLPEADIPSYELVEATSPTVEETGVPDLDWASTVESEPFAIGAHTRRKWMPVAAAVGAVLLIVAVILFRKSGEDSVAREGLPVAVDAANASPAPSRRTEDTAALVTPPAVPDGRPSDVPVVPAARDTAPEPLVMPAAPVVGRRVRVDPGVVTLAPVNLGGSGGMRSHADLMRFYDQQYGQAQAALEAELVRAGFSRLFGISTLTTSDGLASGRRALAIGRSALSSYRTRQAGIEQAYQDSLRTIGRRLGLGAGELAAWAPRPSRREPGITAALADPVLDGADEILELLQREIGRYRLQGNTLVFESRSSAERYAGLRASVERGVAGLDQSHLTLRAVSRAIGASLPLEVVN